MQKNILKILLLPVFAWSGTVLALSQSELAGLANRLAADQTLRSDNVTAGYAQLIGFISDASTSGYVLNVDNRLGSQFDIVKLPLATEIAEFDDTKLLLRGGFNYAKVDSRNLLAGISQDEVKPQSEAYSGLVGLMLALPLSKQWTLKPAIDVGIGRINNSIGFRGADALQAKQLIENLVVNWSTDVALANIGLGVEHRVELGRFTLTSTGVYNHSIISSFSEPKNLQGFTKQTDLLHFAADLSSPLGLHPFAVPLTGVFHVDSTVFLGENSDALGFSNLAAFGYRVEADLSKKNRYITQTSIGGNYLYGDNVEGYEIVFDVDF
ncbi:MAG: hypothetical protein Q7U57_09440 [Methylovulum sp.]|nr:hypothetical protein [Methylovulum sp.]